MKIVVAPDSFKECLSAEEAASAMARGVQRAAPGAEVVQKPVADGGEGTAAALAAATNGRLVRLEATGPLGEPVAAHYAVLGDGETAVVEMAAASGLAWVPAARRDATRATTRGTGELIAHALDAGYRRILLGLGGSATNDGGAGMAQALGYRLLDAFGDELPPGGSALAGLTRIDPSGRHPALEEAEVLVACDVDNPLCGPRGASRVYGPQKGAGAEAVERLDAALARLADRLASDLGRDVADVPGAGAAGGLGAGALAFLDAELRPGLPLVAGAIGLGKALRDADLCLTGEGRIDAQTASGKAPAGVARMAAEAGVPTIALAGEVDLDPEAIEAAGWVAAFAITPGPMPLEEALARAAGDLATAAGMAVRMWLAGRSTRRRGGG